MSSTKSDSATYSDSRVVDWREWEGPDSDRRGLAATAEDYELPPLTDAAAQALL